MRLLLFFLVFLNILTADAQENYLPEGRNWATGHYLAWSQTYPCSRVGICGDTLINDTLYQKLVSISGGSYGTLRAFLRQEDQKIWKRQNGQEVLYYDYSIEIGDTVIVSNQFGPSELTVSNIYYQSYNGVPRKTIDFNSERWIEGIGSSNGFENAGLIVFDADTWMCSANDWNSNLFYTSDEYETCNCSSNLNLFCQEPFNFSFVSANTSCEGISNGSTTFSNVNSCVWPDGVVAISRDDLSQGTYIVQVFDLSDNISYVIITIEDTDLIHEYNDSITRESCDQSQNGSIEVNITDGVPPYSYDWGNESLGTAVLDSISSGIYSLIATDSLGCMDTMEYFVPLEQITVYAYSTINGMPEDEIVVGMEVGLHAGVFYATSPISYQWSPSELIDFPDSLHTTASPDSTTTFVLIVQDSLNCIGIDSVEVIVEIPDNIEGLNRPRPEFNIYLIPSLGEVVIESSEIWKFNHIIVRNVEGKEVYASFIDSTHKAKLDLTLGSGLYFISIEGRNNSMTKKVFIE